MCPPDSSGVAERFRAQAVCTHDDEVTARLLALRSEHPVSSLHHAGIRYLGSDFTFARRVSAADCSRLSLPAYYAGVTLCLIRLHPQLEKTFGLFAEIPVVYSPWDDLRGPFVRCLTQLLEILPPQRRQVESGVFFIFTGAAPHDQIRRHSTPELRLIHLPNMLPDSNRWGDAILESLSESLFATDLYSRQGYVVGEEFYGREQVLLQLQSNIAHHRVSGIFGLRKTGKTSVLKQLQAEAPGDQCFVYKDLENIESVRFGNPTPKVLLELGDDIRQSLQKHGGWVQSIAEFVEHVRAGKGEATLNAFDEALRLLLNNRKNRNLTIILALDEIEHLLPADMKLIPIGQPQDEIARLFGILRAHWQTHDNFVFILAGVTAAAFEHSEIYGRSNPLFRIAAPIWLASLGIDESIDLLRSIGQRQGMEWEDAACHLAVEASGGHPLLLRQIGSAVFAELPAGRLETEIVTEERVVGCLAEYRKASMNDVGEMISHMKKFYPDDFDILKSLDEGMTLSEAAILSPPSVDRLERLGLITVVGTDWRATPLLSLAGQLFELSRRQQSAPTSLDDALMNGETDAIEFKGSFAVDLDNKGIPTEKLQWSCLRALVSFLNSRGGLLLIGVADDGSVLGVDGDVGLRGSRDAFIRSFNNAIRDHLGPGIHSACECEFIAHSETCKIVLQVRVPQWREPVFLLKAHKGGGDPNKLYVRNHAQTSELGGRDLMQYVTQHWPGG